MVKKLRAKFILVTMLLLIAVFIILFSFYMVHTGHWNEYDTLQIVTIISDNGHINRPDRISNKDYSVYLARLDENNQLLDIESTEENVDGEAVERIARKILEHEEKVPEDYRYDSYIYVVDRSTNGIQQVVFVDTAEYIRPGRTIGIIILVVLGLAMIFVVSYFLSNFITEPAVEELNREKQFVSNVSHELKTPLAAIKINAEALLDKNLDNRYLQNIQSESDRMDKLIHRLLHLSYLEEKDKAIEMKRVNLSDLTTEVSLSYESVAYEKNVSFEEEIEEDIYTKANPDEIKQLIVILIDNAIKHAGNPGEVTISLAKEKRHAILSVHNTGPEISEEDLPHIFERFYKADDSRHADADSFGLGLAIAKTIVDLHHGEISVENIPNQGVTFRVLFL